MKIYGSEQCAPKASMVKLDMTEFVLLVIGEGVNEIHRSIVADQWLERNPLPD